MDCYMDDGLMTVGSTITINVAGRRRKKRRKNWGAREIEVCEGAEPSSPPLLPSFLPCRPPNYLQVRQLSSARVYVS